MGTSRFPKERRLRTRSEFDRIQRGSGARAHTRHFLLLAAPRPSAAPASDEPRATAPPEFSDARLGIIATRRVGSAVRRNRAKRLVRQFFRLHAAGLGAIDVVVVVKTGAHLLSQAEADAELAAGLARVTRGAGAPGKGLAR